MKKPLLSLLLLFISYILYSQTFHGVSSSPTDNNPQAGPTVAVAPPASMQTGDLVIIFTHYRATGAALTMSQTSGQTWTAETANSGSTQTTRIFWCTFNGTWGANPSVTAGAGNTNGMSVVMYVFRPSTNSNSWKVNVSQVNGSTTGSNPNTITGVTTTASNTVTMAFWSTANTNTWGTLNGAGWSKASLSAQYRNTTGGQSHSTAYNIQTTTVGATNNVSQNEGGTATAARTSIISWSESPVNDNCANATVITTAPTCIAGTSSFTSQTLNGASVDGSGITSNCSATNNADVWYRFVAQSKYPIITVSNLGANWTTRLKVQLLSGSCGSFTEVGCGNNTVPAVSFPLMPSGNGLTIGNSYYIRIQKNNTGTPTGGSAAWAFDICVTDQPGTMSGRMNEVFKQTILSGPGLLQYPWEITYGPDNQLWITEARGYKVYRMDPNTGAKTTVLDISQGSTWLPSPSDSLNVQFSSSQNPWPQGGFAGLALHPDFLDASNLYNFVYVSYVHRYLGGSSPTGIFFRNKLVRFTYNTATNRLETPVVLCDTLPGSGDHNSQRMIMAPVGGTYYLFYASGDMGSGQFANRDRAQRAQLPGSYEGKILRFNLESDGDAGSAAWIPNDNPYSSTSAVWSIGIRNNQGFAFDTTTNLLYGSSHGPYSDDEINIIEPFRNYGHPLVIGYYSDGNYNGTTTPSTNTSLSAGAAFTDNSGNSSCSPVGNETTQKNAIDTSGNGLYKDPLFSAYAANNATIRNIWQTNPGNGGWPSEGWSGLDLYSHKLIPGWKRSLVAASLKWGRLVRIKLGASGTITVPSNDPVNNAGDTISYFGSTNRFRDLAFSPDGKDIFVVMDNNSTTSGPGAANPSVAACQGCVQKYTFLGYNDNGGKSSIPTSIDVTTGTLNSCADGTTITIDNTNNNIWVPITGPDGNIMAEIKANSNNLGVVTSSFYTKSGTIRQALGKRYSHRNITITPTVQPSSPVSIRLYISKAEFDALDADPASGITAIGDVKILKNADACGAVLATSTQLINPTFAEAHGADGYVLQGNINSFSSFYFGNSNITLPLELVYFKGSLQNDNTLLQWETINENNTSHFDVERSLDGRSFSGIGTVAATGSAGTSKYDYTDHNVTSLLSPVIYYRLKMMDKDGKYKYSNIVTISLADITGTVSISPNPTNGQTRLLINSVHDGKVDWKLMDNNGRIVMKNTVHIRRGNNNITINAGGLKNGMYYLHVSGAGINQNLKLQKM